ncbi:hypothetical protein ACFFV7_39120 [Nonomuraea spiralis]|uniref:Uncharacterized protein n=1 Tax=Nonomuraea spiralis TaxID=46182 RepID=A0ABV5IU06_9ACTN|nr:hypothetical protein [Nonomuraea spiralis]GGT42577.1 hypothetical protein GCM10010176_102610 [Nonomuraea spiralis]
MTHVILDGTLIASDHVAGLRENGNDLWFSQKHKAFGGNVQFLAARDSTPLWVSDAEPGSTAPPRGRRRTTRQPAAPGLDGRAQTGTPRWFPRSP